MFRFLISKASKVKSEMKFYVAKNVHASQPSAISPEDQEIVNLLRTEGVAITSLEALSPGFCAKIMTAVDAKLTELKSIHPVNKADYYQPPLIQTIHYPSPFLDAHLEQRILQIIESYLGLPAALEEVQIRWDFSNNSQAQTLLWHRDGNCRKIIKVFIYPRDILESQGPFEYIPKQSVRSKRLRLRIYWRVWQTKFRGLDNESMRQLVPESHWKLCPVSAGTVIIATVQEIYHHGTTRKCDRPALFYIYTASPPRSLDLFRDCLTRLKQAIFPPLGCISKAVDVIDI